MSLIFRGLMKTGLLSQGHLSILMGSLLSGISLMGIFLCMMQLAFGLILLKLQGEPITCGESAMNNPIIKFRQWYRIAQSLRDDASVCSLATFSETPSLRAVLLKGITDDGFVFYTNYLSDKAISITQNPFVCLSFYWHGIERQVVINGYAKKISREQSIAYFNSRPYISKIGAWASTQSKPIKRILLLLRVVKYVVKFKASIPCPEHWGGYIIEPVAMSFLQMRDFRLHTVQKYQKIGESWNITTVSP